MIFPECGTIKLKVRTTGHIPLCIFLPFIFVLLLVLSIHEQLSCLGKMVCGELIMPYLGLSLSFFIFIILSYKIGGSQI